jgi:hypothetical protein
MYSLRNKELPTWFGSTLYLLNIPSAKKQFPANDSIVNNYPGFVDPVLSRNEAFAPWPQMWKG